jgi:MFS family permease
VKKLQFDQYKQLFGYPSFRAFWLGYTFSILGDTMTRVALTWLVWELTESAWSLGLLTFAYTAPVVAGGLLAGWLLDRYGERRVMIIDSLLRGFFVLLIPLLNFWGRLELWHIYVVAAVYGSLFMIPLAGGPTLVPRLVPKQHLATANALEMLTFTVSSVVGAPLAGFLIAWISAPNVLIVDAFSYLLFVLFLLQVAPLVEAAVPAGAEMAAAPPAKSYRLQDAFTLLRHNKILQSTTLMFMAFNVGMGALFVWLPIFADEVLGGGAELYGLLLGVLAVGEVLSSFLAGGLVLAGSLGMLICSAQFLSGLSLALLLPGKPLAWPLSSLLLFGLFSAPLTIWAQTLRMQIIPEALRGRTFALLRTLMQGANPLGGLLGGFLLPVLGMPLMIILSVATIAVPGLLGYQVKELRWGGVLPEGQQEPI